MNEFEKMILKKRMVPRTLELYSEFLKTFMDNFGTESWKSKIDPKGMDELIQEATDIRDEIEKIVVEIDQKGDTDTMDDVLGDATKSVNKVESMFDKLIKALEEAK